MTVNMSEKAAYAPSRRHATGKLAVREAPLETAEEAATLRDKGQGETEASSA